MTRDKLQHEHAHLHDSHADLVTAIEHHDEAGADQAVSAHLTLPEELFRRE